MNVSKKMGLYLASVGFVVHMAAYPGAMAAPVIGPVTFPDLEIRTLSVDIVTNVMVPIRGYLMTAEVLVHNAGSRSASGAYLDIWTDSSCIPACGSYGSVQTSIATLAPGAFRAYVFTFVQTPGSYTYRAFVDSQCTVIESSEANNQSTQAYIAP